MKKYLTVGVAAFALFTGSAMAQQSMQSTTKSYNADGSVQVQKKASGVDANGVTTEHEQNTTADQNGTETKSVTQQDAPDGTSVRTKEHAVTNADGTTETHKKVSKEKW
jgi:hypothetical protein